MAELALQKITQVGITPAYVAANAGGDTLINNGRMFLHVKNGSASSITVTITSQRACDQGFDHDLDVTVAASDEAMIGPFPEARFNNATEHAEITYDDVTSVTVAAFYLPF